MREYLLALKADTEKQRDGFAAALARSEGALIAVDQIIAKLDAEEAAEAELPDGTPEEKPD